MAGNANEWVSGTGTGSLVGSLSPGIAELMPQLLGAHTERS